MGMVRSKFGPITVLVNNAGISGVNKPTTRSLRRMGSLDGRQREGRFLLHEIRSLANDAGWEGSIINLSSIYGIVAAPDIPYHASKGAVRMMTKTDALLYASKGIRVNSVHPGFIWTPLVENSWPPRQRRSGTKSA